jgi:hypothetical protein
MKPQEKLQHPESIQTPTSNACVQINIHTVTSAIRHSLRSSELPAWKLHSGERVVNRYNSHLHPGVEQYVPEALARIAPQGKPFVVETIDFGTCIGETVCVETGPSDVIVFAQRSGRQGLSRFVRQRSPEPCSSLTVILKKAQEQHTYVLITAYIGCKAEPEPWDRHATDASQIFWLNHALLWGSEPVIPGTETQDLLI